MTETGPWVGKSIPPVEGDSKAGGRLRFLQDITLPGMLHAKMVLSGRPHATIECIRTSVACAVPGVAAVVTAEDVRGANRVGIVLDDQPLFADAVARYEGDCVALVGAADYDTAVRAAALVEVGMKDLPSVASVGVAEEPGSPKLHAGGNLAVTRDMIKGDLTAGEAGSRLVVEETFTTAAQEHAYLEPLGALAVPGPDDAMEIVVPAQCPFYIREAVARCLGVGLAKVRVVQIPMGGGFGGKEDVPCEICARLAVLAAKTHRPARLVLSREEDIVYTSKRHPMVLVYRMGCDAQGRLTFADILIKADVGAYATLSPVVLFRSTVHAAGPYEIPNVRVRTRGYYTTTAPKGAMRGFGTPQVAFACEAMIDEMAGRLGMDPIELRLKNAMREGSETATGQVLGSGVGLVETLAGARQAVSGRPGWFRPRKVGEGVVRAAGVASMFYGVSLGAAGRVLDRGTARVEVLKDGSVDVAIGCTDMGQGALTVMTQITADAFGISPSAVTVHRVDTNMVPDSGPTVASRTTVVSGNAVLDACREIRSRMLQVAESLFGGPAKYDLARGCALSCAGGAVAGFADLARECYERRLDLSAQGRYTVPECMLDQATGQGKAYYEYAFATDAAEVDVDLATGRVEVRKFTAVHDSGVIVNPLAAAGQVEGGIGQGLGLALLERLTLDAGCVASRDLSTYLIPTSLDLTDRITVRFVEHASDEGPFGAKGLGEPAIIPVPAAIANAVSNALGRRVRSLPVDREWLVSTAAGEAPESA
jgi:CO/xanthine dehydrogenase Mo-binding subunit